MEEADGSLTVASFSAEASVMVVSGYVCAFILVLWMGQHVSVAFSESCRADGRLSMGIGAPRLAADVDKESRAPPWSRAWCAWQFAPKW